jgi:nucleoside-diphosphate-sugar epimerase
MKVLVTGYQGYIGSVLVGKLKARGHAVLGIDTGYFADGILGPPPPSPDIKISRDLRKVGLEDLKGTDAVLHLAALSDDPLGELDPGLTEEINNGASCRLAELAKEAGVRRFLFSSSTSVYGEAGGQTIVSEESPLDPITAYAKSKVAFERTLGQMADDRFTTVSFRNATAYGAAPRIRLCTLVVHNLMTAAMVTGKVLIKSDGTPWRPLVHVEDICAAFLAGLEAPSDAVCGEVYNVGQDQENYQIRDIAEVVALTVPGSTVEITGEHGPDRRSYRVSFAKIAGQLPGFQPRWQLEAGVDSLYRFLKENGFGPGLFQDRRFLRLKQLQYLMGEGFVDGRLFWKRGRKAERQPSG